jgi:hypothetical protein
MKLKELFTEEYFHTFYGDIDADNEEDLTHLQTKYQTSPQDFIPGCKITKHFLIGTKCTKLKSLEGGPGYVGDWMAIENAPNLFSLKFAPLEVNKSVDISGAKIKSLAGIGVDYFTRIGGELLISSAFCGGILGVTRITDLRAVKFYNWSIDGFDRTELTNMLAPYLRGRKDVWELQEALEANKRTKPFASFDEV